MLDQISLARSVAILAHAGQVRKWSNVPYVVHPMKVAAMIAAWECTTDRVVAAAYLHDVLEDTDYTPYDLESYGIRGEIICMLQELVNASKEQEFSRMPRFERKAMDREKLMKVSDEAKFIKLFDRLDNIVSLNKEILAPIDFVQMYKEETVLMYPIFESCRYPAVRDVMDSLKTSVDIKPACLKKGV